MKAVERLKKVLRASRKAQGQPFPLRTPDIALHLRAMEVGVHACGVAFEGEDVPEGGATHG